VYLPIQLLKLPATRLHHLDHTAIMSNFVPPGQQRHLRACMVCSIVQTQQVLSILGLHQRIMLIRMQRFLREGCPNCEDFLRLAGSFEAVSDCTSQVFEGLITLADPTKSWVAKWQRLDGYVRGVYATKVSGILPEEVIDTMENEARIRYIPFVFLKPANIGGC
jgi:transcription elongation factor SPT4